MDKLMDRPWFLRFTALFLAIIVFISVKMGEEVGDGTVGTDIESIRNIPVEVFYDNENLVVTGVPETVNVTIEGPTNIVQTTKMLKDFTLKADLRDLPMGEHTVQIQPENLSDKLQVRVDPALIDVVIEEKITREFRVDPELNERLLAEDFQVVKMEVKPSVIEVTGAKSVIESISFVKASVTGEQGINKTFEQQARVRVLDRDLNKLNVLIEPEEVSVKVEVEEYQKEVPLTLNVSGTAETGVTIDSITTEVKTVTMSGSRKVLDELSEFSVDVDVSKVTESETLDVELKKPKGVTKISSDKIKVKVNATVTETDQDTANGESATEPENMATKEFSDVPITVRGLSEKFKSTFRKPADGLVVVTVTADRDVLATLQKSDFTVYVDATEITAEGEQTFPALVVGPANANWKLSDEEVTMNVELA